MERQRLSATRKLCSWVRALPLALVLMLGFTAAPLGEAYASHYRYGNISWNLSGLRTVTMKVTMGMRRTFYSPTPVLSATVSSGYVLNFGDGATVPINLTVTAVNTTDDWFIGEMTVVHTYPNNSVNNFLAFYQNSARIGTLQNNANGAFRSETMVTFTTPPNNSPVSSMPPIVNVSTGNPGAVFNIAAADPDAGDVLTYSFASSAQMGGGGLTQPAGMTVNGTTGQVTFNTVGKIPGQLYNAAYLVTDSKGATTMIDILVQIVVPSNPPVFNYFVTPANNQVFNVQPGQNVAFNVEASDIDVGDNVTLSVVGAPLGGTFSPVLPASANPVNTAFSWTPTMSDLGTRVLNFTAQDNFGNQTNTSVTIIVSLDPVFNVPPTPVDQSSVCVIPGDTYTATVSATAPDPLVTLSIDANGPMPATMTFSPALPTPAGNTSITNLSWTPAVSDWGQHTFKFRATDNLNNSTDHEFGVVVNTPTTFTSSQGNATISENQPFTYNITVNDPDIPFGDVVDIDDVTLPSWLTLTQTGPTTATLSGTPGAGDVGTHSVQINAEDIWHHCNVIASQSFDITVTPCTFVADITPSATGTLCAGSSVTLTATAADSYSWSTNETTQSIVVPAIGVATYSVTATSGYCSSTATETVDGTGIIPSCNITVTPSNGVYTGGVPTNIYLGYGPQSATIHSNATGGTGFTYAWSGPTAALSCSTCADPVFTPTAPGIYTYTVVATNSTGCTSTCTVTFCVKNVVAPSNGNGTKIYVCHNGNTISISINAVASHMAHPGDALGSCGQGCGSAVARNAAATAAMEEELTLAVFPNPTRSAFHLRIESNTFDAADVVIYDLTGRAVETLRAQSVGKEIIAGEKLATGSYILEVRNGDVSRKTRVTKF